MHALTNTFSGVAGEARIAAEFVRCGFRVADPYWTDDEVDLLVLEREENLAVPLSIQVKSVQFLPDRNQKIPTHAFTQGLKKRYVTKSPAFALAIYLVDTDEIFFIDGPANIRRVYEAQGAWNKKHVAFDALGSDKDVRIAVHMENGIDGDWKVSPHDAEWLNTRVKRLASQVIGENKLTIALDALWTDSPAVTDSSDE